MTVVTDTSVILNLCLLGQEGLLVPLFGTIMAPTQVVAEFQRLAAADSRFQELVFPAFIQKAAPAGTLTGLLNPARLHGGEIAALGLKSIGLLGILIEARQRSLIPAVAPLLDRLHHEARFWVSPSLREAVLRAAGEIS